MSFSRKHTIVQHLYTIKSVPVIPATTYKYLGVHLTSSLSWVSHIESICSDASRTLGYLRRNLKTASADVKKLAYLTFVRPRLEYASSIWNPSQSYLSHDLESIQNRATRFITSQYSHTVSVTSLKQSINLPTLATRRVIARLCLLHTFYFPSQSRHALLTPPPRVSARLNHSHPISRIKCRTLSMNSSFFPHAIAIWNSLPNDIASCPNRKLFRKKLETANLSAFT